MRRLLSTFMVFVLLAGLPLPVLAVENSITKTALIDTAEYMYIKVSNPQVGSVGGEWAVLGLARSGYNVPRVYYDSYYKNVEKYVVERKGILDARKYTEYSRIILALTAAGYDPRNLGGYDLTVPLGDFEKSVWQGVNGPVYALLALDSAGYEVPLNPEAAIQANREMYIKEILSYQLSGGGFVLNKSDKVADVGVTGMALQALAKYKEKPDVEVAIGKALGYLSETRGIGWDETDSESVAQVIVALCTLGIGVNDPRFTKNGKSLTDKLMEYYTPGKGFERIIGGGVNQMATEQALYALAAVYRWENGFSSLYDMSDAGMVTSAVTVGSSVTVSSAETGETAGLPGKHNDIRIMPVILQGHGFSDINGHTNQSSIEALTVRGVINGKSETRFEPNATVTRAELAAIVTRGLGLEQNKAAVFNDVPREAWYAGYVGTAYTYEIVRGTSAETFNPDGVITREEAGVMVTRAAKLCGLNVSMNDTAVRDTLAQFRDYVTVSDWAREPLAFCYSVDILSQDVLEIKPGEPINRSEIAEMLYLMLGRAELL